MPSKESLSVITQAIYDDLFASFESQGCLRQHIRLSVSESHQIFFVCRFPSMIRTDRHTDNLFVIGEDELIVVLLRQYQAHGQSPLSCMGSKDSYKSKCCSFIIRLTTFVRFYFSMSVF